MSNRAERRAQVRALKKSGKSTKGVRREELLRRRLQRGDSALVHGVCRECSRRRILIQPARLCERCLMRAVQPPEMTDEQREQMLAALDEMEEADVG